MGERTINELSVFFFNYEEEIEDCCVFLKTLSHPLRLKIVCFLGKGESSVTDIRKAVNASQSNVSQQIEIMRSRGIIVSRRYGQLILCRLKDTRVLELVENIQKFMSTPEQ